MPEAISTQIEQMNAHFAGKDVPANNAVQKLKVQACLGFSGKTFHF
jgi:hypothetical protein